MKGYFTLFALLYILPIQSQSLSKSVLATSGGHHTVPEATLDVHWSLGELATTTIGTGDNITQGFHQLDLLIDPVYEWPQEDIGLKLFPNPVADYLVLEQKGAQIFKIEIHDLLGRLLFVEELNSSHKEIDIQRLPNHTYLLTLTSDQHRKSFKIIKS